MLFEGVYVIVAIMETNMEASQKNLKLGLGKWLSWQSACSANIRKAGIAAHALNPCMDGWRRRAQRLSGQSPVKTTSSSLSERP